MSFSVAIRRLLLLDSWYFFEGVGKGEGKADAFYHYFGNGLLHYKNMKELFRTMVRVKMSIQ